MKTKAVRVTSSPRLLLCSLSLLLRVSSSPSLTALAPSRAPMAFRAEDSTREATVVLEDVPWHEYATAVPLLTLGQKYRDWEAYKMAVFCFLVATKSSAAFPDSRARLPKPHNRRTCPYPAASADAFETSATPVVTVDATLEDKVCSASENEYSSASDVASDDGAMPPFNFKVDHIEDVEDPDLGEESEGEEDNVEEGRGGQAYVEEVFWDDSARMNTSEVQGYVSLLESQLE